MEHPKKILITGGTGLIGTRLSKLLFDRGYEVCHLTRRKKTHGTQSFVWNIEQHYIEPGALAGVHTIINLAGEGVADKPWSEERKEQLLTSRTKSTRLLYDELKMGNHKVKAFISASGIAYYGVEDNGRPYTEEDKAGSDFMARLTQKWEAEIDKVGELMRVCKIRTGVVLSTKGGALPKLAEPVKWYVGAPFGTGNQYMNWIHIDDLCAMYIRMIEDETLHGAYNGVAPNQSTNREFTQALARTLKKPLWLPAVPEFALKLMVGEMSYILLKAGRGSAEKIEQTGFKFTFPDLDGALSSLLTQDR
jgi:uncharacterized protein